MRLRSTFKFLIVGAIVLAAVTACSSSASASLCDSFRQLDQVDVDEIPIGSDEWFDLTEQVSEAIPELEPRQDFDKVIGHIRDSDPESDAFAADYEFPSDVISARDRFDAYINSTC